LQQLLDPIVASAHPPLPRNYPARARCRPRTVHNSASNTIIAQPGNGVYRDLAAKLTTSQGS
jgi:hypothetical protein